MSASNHLRRLIGILCILSIASSAQAAEKLRLLMIDGQSNHDFATMRRVMCSALREAGRFEVDVVTTPPTGAPSKDWDAFRPAFSKYDVVLSNYNDYIPRSKGDRWPREVEKALEAYVAGGGGLVIIHAANNAFSGWDEWNKMIGLGWRKKDFGNWLTVDDKGNTVRTPAGQGPDASHGDVYPYEVVIGDPDHPVTGDMPAKWMHAADELYHAQRGPAVNLHILAWAYSRPDKRGTGKNEPLAWVVSYGKGRVFTCLLGHVYPDSSTEAIRCLGFQTLMCRGAEWAATGQVRLPIPSNFPTGSRVSVVDDLPPARATQTAPQASAGPGPALPPGYVAGDVVSHSYVPIRQWSRAEGFGICPYLFEYGLMKWAGNKPLEAFHDENIRRIDLASQWSTCIGLYNRYDSYRDEIINLMIRCFRQRQLIGLSAGPGTKKGRDALQNLVDILDKLWENRDRELVSPEGDKATGRQLINNILMVNIGDEELGAIKTAGLEQRIRTVRERVADRVLDGQRPFAHIRTWFNDLHYGMGGYAANKEDLAKGRQKWAANAEFIGVDVYHFWDFTHTPFDPDDPSVPRQRVRGQAVAWQNVITKYHGPDFRVTIGDAWDPKNKNDTHAMLQGIDLARADRAMMVFIGNSDYIAKSCYTTPIETMDAYYDSIKAGPWVGLSWWCFDHTDNTPTSTLAYIDKKLKHYTPDHPEGLDYTPEQLEDYRKRFIASRMRMFNDVVYNQFRHLNGPAPASAGKE